MVMYHINPYLSNLIAVYHRKNAPSNFHAGVTAEVKVK